MRQAWQLAARLILVSSFETGLDTRECRVETRADIPHSHDHDDRDASGNQRVFDCRCAVLILEKIPNVRSHGVPFHSAHNY
jgi:hypothetical protein